MIILRKKFTFFLIFCVGLTLYSSNETIEKLYKQLSPTISQKDKVNIYLQIGMEYEYSNLDSALHYYHLGKSIAKEMSLSKDKDTSENGFLLLSACNTNFGIVHNILGDYQKSIEYYQLALEDCQKIGNKEAIGTIYNNIGIIYAKQSLYNNAIEYCQKGLDIAREVDNHFGIVNSLNNLGLVYSEIGANEEAIKNYYQALDLLESLHDENAKHMMAMCYLSIGSLFGKEDKNDKAISYFTKSAKLFDAVGDKLSVALCDNNIGLIYKELSQYEKALDFLDKSLFVKREMNYKEGIASGLNSIGDIFIATKDFKKAIKNFNEALAIFLEIGNLEGQASVYANLSKMYFSQNSYQKALEYGKMSLKIADEIYNLSNMRTAQFRISEAYEKLKDYKKSLESYKLYKALSDSLYNSDKSKQLIEIETKYETEKKEQENTILKHKNEFNELIISRQNSLRNFLVIIILIVAISMILIYNQYRLKKIAFQELEQADNLIQKQRDELELMNQTRNQFFSIVSHDLKNSFTSLQMGAKMLSNIENFEKDELKMISKEIREIVDNLYKLLENLLEWARLQIGKTHHQPEIINFSDIINDVIKILAKKAEQKQLQIISEVIDCNVFADKNMLYSILQNLIFNAIKFSLPQGIIKICNNVENAQVEIIVSDNGIGMDREHLENLFKLEKMHSQKGTDDEKGTGLGLILCREFVEKNNGEIWVESEPEKGTSVHIILPNKEI